MAVAENSKQLESLIRKKVSNNMSNKLAIDLRNMYRQTITKVVYGAYTPKQYKRRYSLIMGVTSLFDRTNVSLEVFTRTIPNISSPYYGIPTNLLSLIEYGHGKNSFRDEYSFSEGGSEPYARPRPFNRTAYEKAKKINYQKYFK